MYSLELLSEHPLATAITAHLEKDAQKVNLEGFESVTGKGVSARFGNRTYYAGSSSFLQAQRVSVSADLQQRSEQWLEEAKTVVWFADEKEALAVIAITDKVKSTSKAAIQRLIGMGITPYMVTGDNPRTAKAVAQQVGITEFRAETLPSDKADFIKALQQKGHIVGMVGDGINDSHALAQADISIAMGKGTDIAMGVARMTLISSDPAAVPRAVILSRRTVTVIRQNLFWAFIYNMIGIPVAAGLLYPVNGFLLDPMFAGAAMALSFVSVVTNSLRLKYARL